MAKTYRAEFYITVESEDSEHEQAINTLFDRLGAVETADLKISWDCISWNEITR